MAELPIVQFNQLAGRNESVVNQSALLFGLAKIAESRDDDTGQHLARIKTYTQIIADLYAEQFPQRLHPSMVKIISETSIVHDIGKVGIADDILRHAGPYSESQFETMKTHTTIGADILLALADQFGRDVWIDTAMQITLSHHERFDGGGYPFGLAGESISLPARLVSIADVYDALCSKRVYKAALTHEEAMDIINEETGMQFDPEIALLLKKNHKAFKDVLRSESHLLKQGSI
ncbi:MAG: HD domain-containing protein [Phycisphaerales bacterium]|nr:HD domain-containing protein [Phycisphaerales bacterium]